MERIEWLQQMRSQVETLYDHLAPAYWVSFGLYDNPTHRRFIEKFHAQLAAHSDLLSAACGAGRYDGMLVEAGHRVLGIDQSDKMLLRARQHFPQEQFPELRYARIGLQEMDFEAQFDGVICVDAMENICPEEWPGVAAGFRRALKPGGLLYVTVEMAEEDDLRLAYERATARELPVVFGEILDESAAAHIQAAALDGQIVLEDLANLTTYHYYPSLEQVRAWLDQAGLEIVEEGYGEEYIHLLAVARP